MHLNVYVPYLQYPKEVIGYRQARMGCPARQPRPWGVRSEAFGKACHWSAADHGADGVDLKKGHHTSTPPRTSTTNLVNLSTGLGRVNNSAPALSRLDSQRHRTYAHDH